MPDLNKYPKRKSSLKHHVPLDKTNFEQFTKEYTPEYVQGFLAGMQEFLSEADNILFKNADYQAHKKMCAFSIEKEEFLKSSAVQQFIKGKNAISSPL